ncbi:MAG: cytochrome P450 [Mycobacteriales bacterium]
MSDPALLEDDYDPFEAFDRAQGAGVVRTPYPLFAELRRAGAVQQVDLAQVMGLGDGIDLGELQSFSAMTYDAVTQVLRDGETFSSSGYAASMGMVMGHTILEMDEPEHHRYRALIQQAFTRKAMERWEADLVRPIVDRYIDAFADRGSADLVRELCFPFPVHVIAGMLGLPAEDLPQFHRWAVELISVGVDWERGLAASQKLREYFAGILQQRRSAPSNDVISVLAGAELDGHTLTDEEIFAFLRLLLPAGAETTYRSSSNLFFGLLSDPDQLAALRDDRSLLPQAIEEGLRWEPPLTGIARLSMRETVVGGVTVPAGAVMHVNIGAANHDETRWDDPERFDIFREQKPHHAFAFGPHMCLGLHLARMETTVVVNAVLDRLPNVRLDATADDVHITGAVFRAPRALPVVFDVT